MLSNRYFYVDFKLGRFYTLTFAVVLYSFYNTFFKFGILTVVGYIACVALLVVLYFDSVKWGISYIIKAVKKVLHK